MAKPTTEALDSFEFAARAARTASQNLGMLNSQNIYAHSMATATVSMAEGLAQLTVGVRATYMLLEEIKSTMARQVR